MVHAAFVIASCFGAIALSWAFRYAQYEVMYMELILRVKTGFFEKTAYRLEAEKKELRLIPIQAEGAERIVLRREELLSVTLRERKSPELEIQTGDTVYVGVFEEGIAFEETANYLKEHLNTKIIFEYRGGK